MNDRDRAMLQVVAQTRKETADTWPCPPVGHSIDYARTENGEGLDADLRLLPQYVRNNHRVQDPVRERAQTLEMILTALMQINAGAKELGGSDPLAVENAKTGQSLACARLAWDQNVRDLTRQHLEIALWHCTQELELLGADPLEEVRRECARIVEKFNAPPAVTNPEDGYLPIQEAVAKVVETAIIERRRRGEPEAGDAVATGP